MPQRLPHRCSRCYRRITLPYHWQTSGKPIKCASCGYEKFYIDKDRLNRSNKENCCCEAYPYPHRKKSGECKYGNNPCGINNPVDPSDPRLDEISREKVLKELGLDLKIENEKEVPF